MVYKPSNFKASIIKSHDTLREVKEKVISRDCPVTEDDNDSPEHNTFEFGDSGDEEL